MLDMVAGGGVAASERGERPQMALAGSEEAAVVRVESGCGSTRDHRCQRHTAHVTSQPCERKRQKHNDRR